MPVKQETVNSDLVGSSLLQCPYAQFGCPFQPQSELDLKRHETGVQERVKHVELVREKNELLDQKIFELRAEMSSLSNDVTNLKLVTNSDESLSQLKKLVRTFPLCNLKNSQYLHATQLQVASLKEELDKEKALRDLQTAEMARLREAIEELKVQTTPLNTNNGRNSSSFASEQQHYARMEHALSPLATTTTTPMETDDSVDGGSSHHRRADSAYYSASTTSLNSSLTNQSHLSLSDQEIKSLSERMTAAEKKIEEVRKEQERWKQLERFVMHLHERIKSLDCGRTGKLIWKISGFSTIFENAKSVEARKQKNLKVDPNTPCDFCSPLFYTSLHGYLLYMRLYPYGCDSAVGKFMSLFVALSPGEYDGILPWPFRATLEISLLSQEEPNEKWTQNIVPGGNNIACFQRPSSKSGNLSVGILHFIVHSKLYGQSSSPYIQNDTIYIEVSVKEPENVNAVGPSKPKAARAANPGANTSTRASPDYRPNSGSTITLM